MGGSKAGYAWIFGRSGGVWTQQGPGLIGTGGVGAGDYRGYSVGISSDGNTAVVGDPHDDNVTGPNGAIWIFTRSGGVWTQQGPKLVGVGAVLASQGSSVAISADGNTVIEGGYTENGSEGCVIIFTRSGGVWSQQGPLLVGSGEQASADGVLQGVSVGITPDGNTVVEGGYGDHQNAGAVWVFSRTNSVWYQVGSKLVGSGAAGNPVYQGVSVTISAEGTVIESGTGDNRSVGAAWIFRNPAFDTVARPRMRIS